MTRSAKNYCFTLNNYTQAELDHLRSLFLTNEFKYIILGRETGETGTAHIQGYISCTKRRTFNWIKTQVGTRCHVEIAKGSASSNQEYCSKDGDYEEFGELPGGQGTRTDIDGLLESIKAQVPLKELADKHGGCLLRYTRGVTYLRRIYGQRRTWKSQVFVYWGKAGSGKTKKAWEACEEKAFIYAGGGWFDGYDAHPDAIFDDFSGSDFKITTLLKLLDRYPMMVPVKGGFVNWCPKRIFITSNYPPEEWYPGAKDEHRAALTRRLDEVLHFAI